MGPEQTPGGVGQARWERAGQSRLNLSLTRHHPQVGEAQSCLRPGLLMVNGSPAPRSDQLRGRETPRTELTELHTWTPGAA